MVEKLGDVMLVAVLPWVETWASMVIGEELAVLLTVTDPRRERCRIADRVGGRGREGVGAVAHRWWCSTSRCTGWWSTGEPTFTPSTANCTAGDAGGIGGAGVDGDGAGHRRVATGLEMLSAGRRSIVQLATAASRTGHRSCRWR